MKILTTTIKTGMWMLLCSLCIMACTQEEIVENGNPQDYAGKAIHIIVSGPNNHAVSRATTTKETFKAGDIIHLSTTFTLKSNATDAATTSTVYSCLKYNGTAWEEYETTTLTWPWNATQATFTAYYIPAAGDYKNGSVLKSGTVSISLSDLSQQKDGEDPLMATYTDAPAGSSIYLQFNHILSKVTFTNLDEATANEEFHLIVGGNKQIKFALDGNGILSHQLVTEASGYISNQCTSFGTPDVKEVTFLIPELSESAKIKLARKDMSAYHSLELPQALKAGKHYTIDIKMLADSYVSDAVKEEDWNKDAGEATLDADGIKKYLHSIQQGEPCTINNKQILITYKDESDNHVVAQVCDVDFNNAEFQPVNTTGNIIFQGNGHKISNLKIKNTITENGTDNEPNKGGSICKALFGNNSGTIKNLIIDTAEMEANTDVNEKYAGILTGINNGVIDNVSIRNVTIATETTHTAESVGIITGSNIQSIKNCRVSGKITISIKQTDSSKTISIGGIAGASSGTQSISNCEIQGDDDKKSISVDGNYVLCYVGGLAGQSKAINNCSTNLDIAIESGTTISNHLYAGGLAGSIGSKPVKNSTSTGNITIPSTLNNSTAGGFTGYLQNSTLYDCAASGDITGGTIIGGLVGNVNATAGETAIRYSSATGEVPKSGAGALIGKAEKTNPGTLVIENSFCINGTGFISNGQDNATISNCHLKGISTAVGGGSFIPTSGPPWTIIPAIYGKDANSNDIYYLKRTLIPEITE